MTELAPQPLPPPESHGEGFALRVIQIGSIAAVLAVTTFNAFELDRFFVPKELALHLTALLAGFVAFRALREASRVDLLLGGFLILSTISTLFATNHWLAIRALTISTSGVLLFWSARAIRNAGLEKPLLGGLALAVVIAAITALAQAYGIDITLFSENRSPGGTLGNRNFIAHVAAFGSPLLLLAALRARTTRGYVFGSLGFMIVVATLVLTRSRAAWLAFAAVMLVFLGGVLVSKTWRRFFGTVLIAGAGVAAALLIPNTLKWRSDNPYLESVKRVADYERGSGRGRLVQYQQSLLLAARHPLFGAGPGNWAVDYPAHAARNDPSLNDADPGTTLNPWPSSDWIAWVSERGIAAVVLIALALIGVGISALRGFATLESTALLAVLIGAVVAGLFDAVLLTALPSLIVWTSLGALFVPRPGPSRSSALRMTCGLCLLLALVGVLRSASQIVSMSAYVTGRGMENASVIDPGNYRLQLRLARSGGRHRCEHAEAAHALYPNARAANDAQRGCR